MTETDRILVQRIPQTARHVLQIGAGDATLAKAYRAIQPTASYWIVCGSDRIADLVREDVAGVFVGDLSIGAVLDALRSSLKGAKLDAVILPDCETLSGHHDVLKGMMDPAGVWLTLLANAGRADAVRNRLLGREDVTPAFSQTAAIEMVRHLGMHVTDAVAVTAPQDPATIDALISAATALGADAAAARNLLRTDHWLVRSSLTVTPPLTVVALGLRRLAGVTEARVDYPMQALASLPSVTAAWDAGTVTFPKGVAPGIFLLHRQFLNGAPMIDTVERMIGRGWTIVSDMDDDPHHWAGYVDSNFRAFRGVHAVTVSTEAMATLMRQWNPEVAIFPNHLPALPEVPPVTPKTAGRLRLFFGALNRTGDWPAIVESLADTALKHADRLELVVVHDRAFFDALPEGIMKTFHPTLPHPEYMQVLASCDLALLPLADTPFNRLKSDLKLIECAGAGVVPICSRVIYADDPEHHTFALFPDGAGDWSATLTALLAAPGEVHRRREIGLDYVARRRLHSGAVADRAAWFRDLIARRDELEAQRRARLSGMAS